MAFPRIGMRPILQNRSYLTLRSSVRGHGSLYFDASREGKVIRPSSIRYMAIKHAQAPLYQTTEQVGMFRPESNSDEGSGLQHMKDDFQAAITPFKNIPRQPLIIGALGILPYAVLTTASSVLGWKKCIAEEYIYRSQLHRQIVPGLFEMNADSLNYYLDLAEKIQIGYGAVIISFIGAIHWGLELARYGGSKGYARYLVGIVGPILAWPTVLMDHHAALIAQFGAFSVMYVVDSVLSAKGWTPSWYGPYRFTLTLIVGLCLITSLIVNGLLNDRSDRSLSSVDRLKFLYRSQDPASLRISQERVKAESDVQRMNQKLLSELEADSEELSEARKVETNKLQSTEKVKDTLKKSQPVDLQDV